MVTPELIKKAFAQEKAFYTSLLIFENGKPHLRDYFSNDKNPRVVVKTTHQDVQYTPMTNDWLVAVI